MGDEAKKLGARIRALRKERGWSQSELARRIGVDRPHVARAERGVHLPEIITLQDYAQALSVTLYDIVSVIEREQRVAP